MALLAIALSLLRTLVAVQYPQPLEIKNDSVLHCTPFFAFSPAELHSPDMPGCKEILVTFQGQGLQRKLINASVEYGGKQDGFEIEGTTSDSLTFETNICDTQRFQVCGRISIYSLAAGIMTVS